MIDLWEHHLFDGGMGTMLQAAGLEAGECPERLNLTAPETVAAVHAAYAAAGADIITANTFGASRRKLGEDPAPYIDAGVALAKKAGAPYAALDVGPLGGLMAPFGDMTFDEAYEQFTEIVRAGAAAGADLVLIETMSDLLEAKAALLAAKEHTDLPVFVTMTFGEDGRTFLGTDPACAAVTLTSLGADVVGINCSLGPAELAGALEAMLAVTDRPVMIQPNAGLPRLEGGETVFDVGPEEFARWGKTFLDMGGRHPGGLLRHHTGPHPGVGPPAAGPEAPAAPSGGGGQPLLRLAGEPGHGPGLGRRRGGANQPHRPAEAEGGPVRQELGLRRGAGPPGAAGGGGLPGGQRRAPGHRRGGGPAQSRSWPSSGCRPCPWSSTAPTPPPWSGPSGSAGAGPS